MRPRKMDPLLTEMFKYYDEKWRKHHPEDADIMDKSVMTMIFLRIFTSTGRARLMMGEDSQPIWKATERLVREVGPELGSLQPCPAADKCPSSPDRLQFDCN